MGSTRATQAAATQANPEAEARAAAARTAREKLLRAREGRGGYFQLMSAMKGR